MNKRNGPGFGKRYFLLVVFCAIALSTLSCSISNALWEGILSGITPILEVIRGTKLDSDYIYKFIEDENDEEYDEEYDGEASLAEDGSSISGQGSGPSTDSGLYGLLKPVGFVNYGEIDATVRAYSFIPLGKTEAAIPPAPSTVSSANNGSGEWPNPSRYLSLPMGAYSWCIDWEEGDVDEDGKIDYFHYIQEGPTILDENDSDDLDLAEEVPISAPPLSGAVYEGKCKVNLVDSLCEEFNSAVNIYSLYAMEQDNPPEIKVSANAAEQAPPPGIDVSAGGVSTGYGMGMILWQDGDWVEVTTGDPYQGIGVQVHGDQTIGWARVLFDGQEIWRGDTSSHIIAEGRYGVYVEVRCFPPGSHTLRIEGLGQDGSGGGRSIPVSYFSFRE
jgi:hypothetical protein